VILHPPVLLTTTQNIPTYVCVSWRIHIPD
jgi:hypothetical protein